MSTATHARPPVDRAGGKILLRLTLAEHARLVQEAAAQGVSLNHYLVEIIAARLPAGKMRFAPKG